jgi:quercetin dioxygenase-like cupin family protein
MDRSPGDTYYCRFEDFQPITPFPKIRPTIIAGEKIMMAQVRAQKGGKTTYHRHEAEQIFVVLQGEMRVRTNGGPPRILRAGDVWWVPSNTPHQAEYLKDTLGLEAASPLRLDNFVGFLPSHTYTVVPSRRRKR